jgi:hypothetical protein
MFRHNPEIWEKRNMEDMEEANNLEALLADTRNYLETRITPAWEAAARQLEEEVTRLAYFTDRAGNSQDGQEQGGGRKRRTRRKRKRKRRKKTRKKRKRRRKRTKKKRRKRR